jgi:hypothetical protein
LRKLSVNNLNTTFVLAYFFINVFLIMSQTIDHDAGRDVGYKNYIESRTQFIAAFEPIFLIFLNIFRIFNDFEVANLILSVLLIILISRQLMQLNLYSYSLSFIVLSFSDSYQNLLSFIFQAKLALIIGLFAANYNRSRYITLLATVFSHFQYILSYSIRDLWNARIAFLVGCIIIVPLLFLNDFLFNLILSIVDEIYFKIKRLNSLPGETFLLILVIILTACVCFLKYRFIVGNYFSFTLSDIPIGLIVYLASGNERIVFSLVFFWLITPSTLGKLFFTLYAMKLLV